MTYNHSVISFYHYEIKNFMGPKGKDPSIYIITKVDGKTFKRVLIDEGAKINTISLATLGKFNLPHSQMLESTLHLCAFDDSLCPTLGIVVLSLTIGVRTIHTLLHMVDYEL